jgi:hypothetical protein
MLCDTSVDAKSTGMSLVQHLVLSSLRALCPVPSGGGVFVAIRRTKYAVCRVSAQEVPRAYRSAPGRSKRLSSWGAVAVLAIEWELVQLADRFVAIDRGS